MPILVLDSSICSKQLSTIEDCLDEYSQMYLLSCLTRLAEVESILLFDQELDRRKIIHKSYFKTYQKEVYSVLGSASEEGTMLGESLIHELYISVIKDVVSFRQGEMSESEREFGALGENDVNRLDVLEYRRCCNISGRIPESGSYKEDLTEEIGGLRNKISFLTQLQEKLVEDYQHGNYRFKFELSSH